MPWSVGCMEKMAAQLSLFPFQIQSLIIPEGWNINKENLWIFIVNGLIYQSPHVLWWLCWEHQSTEVENTTATQRYCHSSHSNLSSCKCSCMNKKRTSFISFLFLFASLGAPCILYLFFNLLLFFCYLMSSLYCFKSSWNWAFLVGLNILSTCSTLSFTSAQERNS